MPHIAHTRELPNTKVVRQQPACNNGVQERPQDIGYTGQARRQEVKPGGVFL